MLTLTDVVKLKSVAEDGIISTSIIIAQMERHKCNTRDEYKKHMQELNRQRKLRTKFQENKTFFLQVEAYIKGGMSESSLEAQRNGVMVQLRTIDERLKYHHQTGELRVVNGVVCPYDRTSKNREEKKIIEAHDRKYNVKKLKSQLKALNYILKC